MYVSLDIAYKVIIICDNNAPNNNIFCDHFYIKLKIKYNNNP
jgi:hypothetical protein